MLDGLARLGRVGTRIIERSSENTVEDLRLLQPILSQLAAAVPDLANSLELLLTYPFPDSSLSALNYRKAQTGGYGLFTNMTATLDLDLTSLLCRYAIDPAVGSLEVLPPEDAPEDCGVPGGQGDTTAENAGEGAP
jgi:phospholipid/cholesterol/gamma-HCH transport system substrate-binding protein